MEIIVFDALSFKVVKMIFGNKKLKVLEK